ncbi:PREDICTED: dnaJ-like protein 60 [Nicrophorus vespilloides]|uniref:DnaJ-like protein 60 n=1 Tax=Nicrophorus vespilloides TaxID=110193 RepID=A0ABM1NIG6_NICVS|nr:PREDICTED: dnaJ-like protein 60 [Nicrophorus vespilloides]
MIYSSIFAKFRNDLGNRLQLIRRNIHKNHYETLNLRRDCSQKDIRDAYIKLSKQYHPDKTKNILDNQKFSEISEAYNTLSKTQSRSNYDLGLATNDNVHHNTKYRYRSKRSPFHDPSLWRNRNRSYDRFYESQPYYGIQGVQKVSNAAIVILCVILTLTGFGLQIIAIRNSITLDRERMNERSFLAAHDLSKSREEAEKNGNKIQLQRLKDKLKISEFDEKSISKGE